jgi:hypothetical protein
MYFNKLLLTYNHTAAPPAHAPAPALAPAPVPAPPVLALAVATPLPRSSTAPSQTTGIVRRALSPASHYRQLAAEARSLTRHARASRRAALLLELSALAAANAKEDEDNEDEDEVEEENKEGL